MSVSLVSFEALLSDVSRRVTATTPTPPGEGLLDVAQEVNPVIELVTGLEVSIRRAVKPLIA